MRDRLRGLPAPSTRYSKTIPPEMRGKISGSYRIDVEKTLELARLHRGAFAKMPGQKRKNWHIGGVLLRDFGAYRLLPSRIVNNDCEQRRDLLSFIAAETTDAQGRKEYGELPSVEAISIEIARIVLENIAEWNKLPLTTQLIIEPEIIGMINAEYEEFMDVDKAVKEHELGKPTNLENMETEAKKKVLAKIVQRIKKLAEEYGTKESEAPTSEELAAVADETAAGIERIIENQRRGILPPKELSKTPTIPAGPQAKRKAAEKK